MIENFKLNSYLYILEVWQDYLTNFTNFIDQKLCTSENERLEGYAIRTAGVTARMTVCMHMGSTWIF